MYNWKRKKQGTQISASHVGASFVFEVDKIEYDL